MRRVLTVVLLVGAGAGAAWLLWHRHGAPDPLEVVPGEGDRVTVEVLNGTRTDGLARVTTAELRRHGLDVVYFGSAPVDTLTTTAIVVRRGDSTAAMRVREVLGVGRIENDPDSTLLLDVSVLLGNDAIPPADGRDP